ncbi:MAG: hypothetical protein H6538_05965 [Bacteroidales bacterium]|nr:hypothetical protein [Bacteroidales bacterium]MCB8999660.1 hypothetical protein [Bacteroidales bacterium]MCB9012759.1 hypothetical protein [Bacteroidales bacterium]
MSKKTLSIIVLLIIALIISLIIIDFIGKSSDKRGENPYDLDVDQYKLVDSSLIRYRETKNFPLGDRLPGAIDVYNGLIYLGVEDALLIITPEGLQKKSIPLTGKPESIRVTASNIIIAYKNEINVFDSSGKLLSSWKVDNERTIITSVAVKDSLLFVADAGNRRVLRYTLDGKLLGEFTGKRESTAGHGFIVPSANFDLVVNKFGELWVVNPGEHSIENYSDEGELRGFWTKNSMEIDGFSGCCNPAELAVMDDGSFITSEKALVRIKVYDPSGRLLSVVAPPEKFLDQGHAPEVAADSTGVIYALDFDRKMIRVFEKTDDPQKN